MEKKKWNVHSEIVCKKPTVKQTMKTDRLKQIAGAANEIVCSAFSGNSVEDTLSIAAHDPLRDVEQLRKELTAQSSASGGRDATSTGSIIPDANLVKLFRAVGTAAWKLAGRMLDEETKEPKDEYRRLWRHVEAIRDALAEIGVDVIDWTGKRYDEGMSLKVVSEEERPGTKEPEIIETLLPTIRFRKQVQLQQGEVVVSRPAATTMTNDGRALARMTTVLHQNDE